MTRRLPVLVLAISSLLSSIASAQTPSPAPLRVVSAGPTGDVASAGQANEVRVVFSEPMVVLGRVPENLKPPFFSISPAVAGTFRWSGTTILIFTPAKPLPLATRYRIAIAPSATAVSGRKLASPYTFTFTTPTAKLLETSWYRPGDRFDAAPIVVLRFNQPVKPDDVAAHVHATFERHDFTAPVIPAVAEARLRQIDPAALKAFADKVEKARGSASATAPVALTLAKNWDKRRFRPSPDLVVFQAQTPVPPESWVKVETDGRLPSPAGDATSGRTDAFVVKVERAFFVTRLKCESECDPDNWNPIEFTVPVKTEAFTAALKTTDVTDPRRPKALGKSKPKPLETWREDHTTELAVEDAGFDSPPPASTWVATLSPDLKSADGQTLGYTWAGVVENWRRRAFTSFGDGHGVWEKDGGAQLPFYARNFQNVKQWAAPVDPQDLMSTVQQVQGNGFRFAPPTDPLARRLGVTPDRIQSHGLDLTKALKPNGTGLVWTAVEEGTPIAHARASRTQDDKPIVRSSIVQVTNLAITVKDSPLNTLLFVTRLDNAAPVAGAKVSIIKPDGNPQWTGTTGADGVAIAPQTRLRDPGRWETLSFLVTAEKDGDIAYVGSDWNEGILPWDFGSDFDLEEADPLLRGKVFTDRGVYKLGEEVHFKAILRSNTSEGIRLLPAGTAVSVWVTDGSDKTIDERVVKLNDWSTAEWTATIPADASLGRYEVRAMLEPDRRKIRDGKPDENRYRWYGETARKSVGESFLVAAYRRPDFRVDVTLTGDSRIAGDPLGGVVTARYLFGAPMGTRPTHWTLTRTPVFSAPSAIEDRFPADRWTFVGYRDDQSYSSQQVQADDAPLSADGRLPLTLQTDAKAGLPYSYVLEGDVEDVSRQHIANRTSLLVHPAPWYIGIKRIATFSEQRDGLKTELVAVGLDGNAVAGVAIDLTLTQIQWISVRRAEGNGFYSWETERKEIPAGSWHVTSAAEPVPFKVDLPAGGFFVLEARADAGQGRFTATKQSFYSCGDGYTAWERYDHNRIELVAERSTYKAGETAKVMIKSPWEQATALVTTEREGIRTHRQFMLASTQQTIDVPIEARYFPNVYVSVLLVKGRSKAPVVQQTEAAPPADGENDPADPGKPAFRLGYLQLNVEDPKTRLTVKVAANKEEYRPANNATVTVDVKDRDGKPAQSELTLWAVDYGVLSLTGYRTPEVVDSVYVRKALQVLTEDSRQKIVSRRVITPKGDTDGGGGGVVNGSQSGVRSDFKVMAFWLGSVVTDARGHASKDVKLPESLTTYRIMAVAGDRASRFGSADSEIRINKPVTLKAAFPRFLAVGDKATFGAVLTSQLKTAGSATVTIESLDPDVMQFADATPRVINVPAGGSIEVRFDAAGRSTGNARVRVTAKLGGESDAFQDVIPVEVLVSPETVSAIGEAGGATATATERLEIPSGIVRTYGGLHVDLASTALVGLGEGARYLVEYPYGCAEQRGSRSLALLLSADLGDAFKLPGLEPSKMRETVQSSLRELEKFQCPSGGFAYWPGECWSTSPYLTAYLLHVFKVASDLKYSVDKITVARAEAYLETELLTKKPPTNEGWWPSYTAWQAYAVKVLVEGGHNEDAHITRLYGYRDRMPIFALAYLNDALVAKGEGGGDRSADLRRRIANAILPEAATAHVEEMSDPYLLWFWNSNVRSTSIALTSLVKAGESTAPYRALVTWLLRAREDGRWGNTQENALALEALVSYYRKFEATVPNFTATATLGSSSLANVEFQGRSADAKSTEIPMPKLLASAASGTQMPLTFARKGDGTLFYSARLRYAVDRLFQDGSDQGIRIERSYAPYVEHGTRPSTTSFQAGDLVRVTLTLHLTKERRYLAVTDPLPAGLEPVESWFATSAADLSRAQEDNQGDAGDSWFSWWERGGFDHVERHDDRVQLFATRLSEGDHVFTYVARATTAGTFRTAPAHAEEMYEPEIFGRTATTVIDVRK